jgi:RNAse (barnase) inhibitor barstar
MHHDIIGTRASRVTDEVSFTQGSAAMLTESPLHLGSEPPPGACISVGAPASLDALYDALERTWPLPSWFGRNLDALYDVLTSPAGDAPRVLRFDALPPLPADTQRALIALLEDVVRYTSAHPPRVLVSIATLDGAANPSSEI